MIPIRVDGSGVEPVTLGEMRAYLRLDPDDASEDALVLRLAAAARAAVEIETRRVLTPGRFRLMLTAWPGSGVLPVPLSPLVAVLHAGLVDARGEVSELPDGLVRPGPDPWEAPCLLIGPDAPSLTDRAALIEVAAGCGGDGPPVPEPLAQAVRLTAAAWFENRGDAPALALPPQAAALVAPHRRMRL